MIYNTNIYCVIGGSGINVIKKFINPNFGIDLYQHFAKPEDDIILGVSSRGIADNISQKTHIFNFIQSISDSLEFSEIPKKLKVIVREELKNGIFKKYDLKKDKAIMEIGAYFSLKKKINYEELKELIIDIEKIRSDKSKYTQLSLFKKITEEVHISDLNNTLINKIIDDVILQNNPGEIKNFNNDIIEIVHPDKLELFYECESYKLRFYKSHGKNDIIVEDTSKIYFEATKKLLSSIPDINQRPAIRQKIFDLQLVGLVRDDGKTFESFYNHITAEIVNDGNKYFRVDKQWYLLENKFLSRINSEAINTYTQNKLSVQILLPWKTGDEEAYNATHNSTGYYIFDRRIKDNIELCDIMYIDNATIYLVHVKNGFNTHMRNLYNQVVLASKRLWTDINSNSKNGYFTESINRHNKKYPNKKLDGQKLFEDISNNKVRVEFVMAFRNNNKTTSHLSSTERINKSESNIAKYCLAQTVKEVRASYRLFNISVIDIAEIK